MGVMERLVLRDDQWKRMSAHIIGTERTRGSSGRDNRMFVEGVLWIARTGTPWRDLPEVFGAWNSVFRRFSRWAAKGVWDQVFAAMPMTPTSSTCSTTAPPFARTSMRPAQKRA